MSFLFAFTFHTLMDKTCMIRFKENLITCSDKLNNNYSSRIREKKGLHKLFLSEITMPKGQWCYSLWRLLRAKCISILSLCLHHIEDDLVPLPHALSMRGANVVLNDYLPFPATEPASHEALHLQMQRSQATKSSPGCTAHRSAHMSNRFITFLIFLMSGSSFSWYTW